MIRVAVPPIGGEHWRGGWNYMLNLLRTMSANGPRDTMMVLFVGNDVDQDALEGVDTLPGVEIIRDDAFSAVNWRWRVLDGLATGMDHAALSAFRAARIDVALEADAYFGWRFPVPTLSWIPDFQHRHLAHLFPLWARVRRDMRFRAQARRTAVLLSSNDAERDCLAFFPAARGRTHVARFAAEPPVISLGEAAQVAESFDLPPRYFFLPNQLYVHKNHKLVIEAGLLLRERGLAEVVVMTGLGRSAFAPGHPDHLRRMIIENNLESHIRMLGSVCRRDVQALMVRATALINPSRFEGWSTTVEEARAAGVPLLLSDIPVHREQAGPLAKYFNPDDAAGLADLMRRQPSRDADVISDDREAARLSTATRDHAFAVAFAAAARAALSESGT